MSEVMIEATGLAKSYGHFQALKDASFRINRGEVVGFVGPNGAGKSTTMKILTTFIAPSAGSATVNGASIHDDPFAVRQSIGYLPETTPLYREMMAYEYLQYIAEMRGFSGADAKARIKKAVEATSLEEMIGKEIRALSKGYKQRVGIAQSLIHEPPLLILDEPMSGLDPNQAQEIRELIRSIGKERTVILSTHNLAEIEMTCDRVLVIAKGNLVADDTPKTLRNRAGRAKYRIVVSSEDKSRDEIRSLLSKINGCASVSAGEAKDDEFEFELLPSGDSDLRRDIFRAAVAAELDLLNLEQQGQGLDEVFRQLTDSNEDAA